MQFLIHKMLLCEFLALRIARRNTEEQFKGSHHHTNCIVGTRNDAPEVLNFHQQNNTRKQTREQSHSESNHYKHTTPKRRKFYVYLTIDRAKRIQGSDQRQAGGKGKNGSQNN